MINVQHRLDQWDRALVDLIESHDLANIRLDIGLLFGEMLHEDMRLFGRMRYAHRKRGSQQERCLYSFLTSGWLLIRFLLS